MPLWFPIVLTGLALGQLALAIHSGRGLPIVLSTALALTFLAVWALYRRQRQD